MISQFLYQNGEKKHLVPIISSLVSINYFNLFTIIVDPIHIFSILFNSVVST